MHSLVGSKTCSITSDVQGLCHIMVFRRVMDKAAALLNAMSITLHFNGPGFNPHLEHFSFSILIWDFVTRDYKTRSCKMAFRLNSILMNRS